MLHFQPLQAKIETGFWSHLGKLKLEQLKLDQGPVEIKTSYGASTHAPIPSFLSFLSNALDPTLPQPRGTINVSGQLYCVNTVEQAINADKDTLLSHLTSKIYHAITSGEAEQDPRLLQHTIMIAYCDLKTYKYTYWLGAAMVSPSQPYSLTSPPDSAADRFRDAMHIRPSRIADSCQEYVASNPGTPFFLLHTSSTSTVDPDDNDYNLVTTQIETHPLYSWASLQTTAARSSADKTTYLVMIDPSNTNKPGWPLRNMLLLAATRWKVKHIYVLCLRQRKGRFDMDASLLFSIDLPRTMMASLSTKEEHKDYEQQQQHTTAAVSSNSDCWELDSKGNVAPRTADLSAIMDPASLASSAVDLNLKLMKWRAAPQLNIDHIAHTSCLLLGAGTLGCSVARSLLGWGVRKITFVDNSKVSYSNPVRQSLYIHEDCFSVPGGRPKAAAAAEALVKIFPGVDAQGVDLSIPMPGHPVPTSELQKVIQDVERLEELINAHDVVFLLLDTRESRWLPALIAAAGNKVAITAALGFDGFVVMRHGSGPFRDLEKEKEKKGKEQKEEEENSTTPTQTATTEHRHRRLGCYFCNDVVAPANSTRDRTMDQQCTVARPGLSSIAGALAVEVMVAVVQHPLGVSAPASGADTPSIYTPSSGGTGTIGSGTTTAAVADSDIASTSSQPIPTTNTTTATTDNQQQKQSTVVDDESELPLGGAPHMIRGQLNGFTQTCMIGEAYSQCTACSAAVVGEYRRRGMDFVFCALTDPDYLEELTGLAQLKRDFDAAEEERQVVVQSDDDGEEAEEEDWEEL